MELEDDEDTSIIQPRSPPPLPYPMEYIAQDKEYEDAPAPDRSIPMPYSSVPAHQSDECEPTPHKQVPVPFTQNTRLQKDFLNPKKIKAYGATRQQQEEEEMSHRLPIALAEPVVHSTIQLENQIQHMQNQLFDPNDAKYGLHAAQLAATTMNYRQEERNYDDLVSVDADISHRPRLVPKQVDSKWKATLKLAPPLEDPFSDETREPRLTVYKALPYMDSISPQPELPAVIYPTSSFVGIL